MVEKRAHMVRVYDEGMFGRLRVRAAAEGRTVGAVVENAVRLYLGQVMGAERGRPAEVAPVEGPLRALVLPVLPMQAQARTMDGIERAEVVEGLRGLVRTVQQHDTKPEQESTYESTYESPRAKLLREMEQREWVRTHPEEEEQ
jgi:plasmid stability protein